MGNALFDLFVPHYNNKLERVIKKFKVMKPDTVAASDSPQLVVGPITSNELLTAPLSGKSCVYYKVEALELTEVDDSLQWKTQFTEERSLPFSIGSTVYVPVPSDSAQSNINARGTPSIEMHTGEDAFPTVEFGYEMTSVSEPIQGEVLIFKDETGEEGVTHQGIPSALKELLSRKRFDIFAPENDMKQKRMRFMERIIDNIGEKEFIGIVSTMISTSTSLGQMKFKLEPVSTAL
jgi:hypothetical protein